eukprot:3219939-Rhodomonas_salina.1
MRFLVFAFGVEARCGHVIRSAPAHARLGAASKSLEVGPEQEEATTGAHGGDCDSSIAGVAA